MLERFTVDSVANQIDPEMKSGELTPKLLRRFFRQGKRDGRKSFAPETMRALLTHAVALAVGRIAQDFVTAREEIQRKTASLMAAENQTQAALERLDASSGGGEPPPSASSGSRVLGNPDTLARPLEALAADEERAKEAERARQREGLRDELNQLASTIAATQERRKNLREEFRQLIVIAHRSGRMLWSRYCSGYEVAAARRGEETTSTPNLEIDFAFPETLEGTADQAAPGEATGPPAGREMLTSMANEGEGDAT